MKQTQNPIALRSKEWLVNALLELMKEKPFQDISISEITAKADLSRRTFYRLFSTKEEILLYYLGALWQDSVEELYQAADHSYFYTSYWYLSFWYQHKELAILLYQNDLISILLKFLNKISLEIYANRKGNYPLNQNQEALEYALAYSSGGSLNVLWRWAGEGMKKSPDELISLLMLALEKPI